MGKLSFYDKCSHFQIVYERNNHTNDFNLYEREEQWQPSRGEEEGNAEILLHWSFPSA